MLNKTLKITNKLISLRDGFGEGIVKAGENNVNVVVITADLKESTRVADFAEKFPERFFDVGVAEQNLIAVASGFANYGKIPFCTSYAVFSPGRTFEQIKVTVALNDVPVKIVGAHAGFGAGPYGATHQALEDIALMSALPNIIIVVPCDSEEARKATLAIAKNGKPSYLRLAREPSALFTTKKTPFKIGKAETFFETKDPQVGIIACGPLVYEAILSAKELEKKGIDTLVINCQTIKPLDEGKIVRTAKTCGAMVTVEEHQIAGGLGSLVSEVLSKNYPVPIEFVGVKDSFGESGKPEELKKKYGLTKEEIIKSVKEALRRKNL